jgi:hypothetical protein
MENDKNFEEFKDWFNFYQKRFGLSGYRVGFKFENLGSDNAGININQTEMTALVRLNSKVPKEEREFHNAKEHAKHEALHLLVGRLEKNGRFRYATDGEIYEATEELVRRLEKLIK